jgi:putative nucleotidyltransferase with HDIG domain
MARVLIVDDEENIRIAFKAFLESDGHEVQTACQVREACLLLDKHAFDVVVSDIIMPGMKGTELLKLLHRESEDIQVIMVTGEPAIDTASEAVRSGAFDYLAKPVSGKELQKVVINAAKVKVLHDEKKRLEKENHQYRTRLEELIQERTTALSEALLGIINAMSVTVEKRDPYTAGHQIRVAKLTRMIAEEMGLQKETVEGAYLAGIIHDVGKISIPAELLSKPSQLLDEEFALIKRHSQTGYDILKGIKFPWPIQDIVLQHHERINGSGYPQALSGDDILIEAKILAVADTVEAMSSHRPYRASLGIDKSLEEIRQKRDILYDAAPVDACIMLFKEKKYEFVTHD